MSMADKHRHLTRKGESKAHSLAHKYDSHKMASVVNHNHFERNHGFESTKHKEKRPDQGV
jgi:ribosomal protein S24E